MPGGLDIVFLGLSITSSWGNWHATTYRGLLRALAARGHRLLFLEREDPDKDMDRQQRVQVRRAHEFHQDQHKKDHACQRSQPFVPNDPGPPFAVLFVCAGSS